VAVVLHNTFWLLNDFLPTSIVESWLSEDVTNNEILLPDYQVHRLDHNRHGGGIALYVHDSLSCEVLLQGGPHNLEFLAPSVTCTSVSVCNKFCICLFYHPPSSPGFIFDNLCTTLQMVNPAQFSTFILLGDFNVNFCNPQHPLFSHVSDILYNFSLVQVVPSFTHVSPNGSTSLIDLALLSDISCLQSCTTLPPLSSSDHLGVSLGIKWKAPSRTTRCKPQRIWNYRDAGMQISRKPVNFYNQQTGTLYSLMMWTCQLNVRQGNFLILWKSVYLKRT